LKRDFSGIRVCKRRSLCVRKLFNIFYVKSEKQNNIWAAVTIVVEISYDIELPYNTMK
jgi:hypothetical protein